MPNKRPTIFFFLHVVFAKPIPGQGFRMGSVVLGADGYRIRIHPFT